MSVHIRFKRVGMPKQPFYRLVAIDSRFARNGKELEVLGHYNPRDQKSAITYKMDRVKYWISCGAKLSDTVKSILINEGFFSKASAQVSVTETPSVS